MTAADRRSKCTSQHNVAPPTWKVVADRRRMDRARRAKRNHKASRSPVLIQRDAGSHPLRLAHRSVGHSHSRVSPAGAHRIKVTSTPGQQAAAARHRRVARAVKPGADLRARPRTRGEHRRPARAIAAKAESVRVRLKRAEAPPD